MGSDPKKDRDAVGNEQPQHEVNLPAFYLARYPMTTAQFQVFVGDSNYQPRDPDDLRSLSNHPVVLVTWYDALAYCRWLNGKLQTYAQKVISEEKGRGDKGIGDVSQEAFWRELASGKTAVTLPSEAEWEKAARGTEGRIYPWGDEFDAEKANFELKIGVTSAVGCFPGGASPYGVLDLSGNVWEWTRSLWGKNREKPDFKYPYNPGKDREDLEAPQEMLRVQRGGFLYGRHARCAGRYRVNPNQGISVLGFRVVVSPSGGA